MAEKIVAVKGMNDLLPDEAVKWEWVEGKIRSLLARWGYRNLRTPIVEPTPLFVRGLGEVTDIVEKEMFSWTDAMNGDRLTLRPEATAGIVRAMIEHNALYNGPLRIWQLGPMFRHERPQKGRTRQFDQLDVEALGHAGPDVDAEIILMLRALWRELGLVEGRHVALELNSLGQPEERKAHRAALIAHFEAHADKLDEDAQRRLHSNPLRILDTKNPAMVPVVVAAPKLMDFLGPESLAHFDAVRAVLDAVGLAYTVNPRLVRGIDYYNLTVFEWTSPLLGAQATVCGGGRYDQLIETLGGKPAPGIGFGTGNGAADADARRRRHSDSHRCAQRLRAGARRASAAPRDGNVGCAARARRFVADACRRRLTQVAVQTRRRQRRRVCVDLRHRRTRRGPGGDQAAARGRGRSAVHETAGRRRLVGA